MQRRKAIDLKTGRVGLLDGYGVSNSAGSSEGITYSDGERGFIKDDHDLGVSSTLYERMTRVEFEMKRLHLDKDSEVLVQDIRQMAIELAKHEARHARIKSMFDLD